MAASNSIEPAATSLPHRRREAGFTLIELAVAIFIMGLMLTLVVPYIGSLGDARLRSAARRIAGREHYLYQQATASRLVFEMVIDFDRRANFVRWLDPYDQSPSFRLWTKPGGAPLSMPAGIFFRDVTVKGVGTFNRGAATIRFYPEGYADAAVIHLANADQVFTVALNPLTGRVAIVRGDLHPGAALSETVR